MSGRLSCRAGRRDPSLRAVVDDSHPSGPIAPAEDRRVRELDELLREKLDASGRFKVVAIPPEIQQKIAAGPDLGNCNGCERGFATRVTSKLALRRARRCMKRLGNMRAEQRRLS